MNTKRKNTNKKRKSKKLAVRRKFSKKRTNKRITGGVNEHILVYNNNDIYLGQTKIENNIPVPHGIGVSVIYSDNQPYRTELPDNRELSQFVSEGNDMEAWEWAAEISDTCDNEINDDDDDANKTIRRFRHNTSENPAKLLLLSKILLDNSDESRIIKEMKIIYKSYMDNIKVSTTTSKIGLYAAYNHNIQNLFHIIPYTISNYTRIHIGKFCNGLSISAIKFIDMKKFNTENNKTLRNFSDLKWAVPDISYSGTKADPKPSKIYQTSDYSETIRYGENNDTHPTELNNDELVKGSNKRQRI